MSGIDDILPPADGSDGSDGSTGRRSRRRADCTERDATRRPLWKRKRLWIPVGVIGVLVIGTAVSAALILPRVDTVQSELRDALPLSDQVQTALLAGDIDTAKTGAAELRDHTAKAAEAADDGVLGAYEWIPFVGPNLHAARVLASTSDRLATDVVTPATEVSLSAFTPVLGRIDLDGIRSLGQTVQTASDGLAGARAELDTIDRDSLWAQVADDVDRMDDTLTSTEDTASTFREVTGVLPDLLGADGARNYLLMFQNNAEVRSTGGNPAALVLLTVEDGTVRIAKQASSNDFPRNVRQGDVPDETVRLIEPRSDRFEQNITMFPDFPTSGALAKSYWEANIGDRVDGVLSFDPIALSYLLEATGPITLATGDQLTAENAVPTLLGAVYSQYPDYLAQDRYFASAASTIFAKLVTDTPPVVPLVTAIDRAIDERRLLMWSTVPEEQTLIEGGPLSGALPDDNTDQTAIGLYFNDIGSGSKMSYYLRSGSRIQAETCGDTTTYTVSVDMTSIAPVDAATSLPRYVTGLDGKAKGRQFDDLLVYGPVGSTVTGWKTDADLTTEEARGTDMGRGMIRIRTELAPQDTKTVDVTFTMPTSDDQGPLEVRHTPLVRPLESEITQVPCSTGG
ncbi:DUF4012 domain-containing protein [Clavibacter californiensis]|uniref:DUF4012 domain-containing protein n=1 Tax=Clavibacter californiensis TaxID=1401995 RepID=A0ABX9N6T4_9MICO|nr:DUF4012 domain-containing protein [Clavibacter californiensis]RII92129.1 DUF4012 domain-containing protein [Clavibacter californiensis]